MAMLCCLRWGISWKKVDPVKRSSSKVFTCRAMVEQQQIIDAHLHVWAPNEEAEKYPYFPGQEPSIDAHAELLLQKMSEAGVSGALIVQPINHKFDHSYVSNVMQKYPQKFAGCCLANPDSDGSGIAELQRLVTEEGYKAVRFNPYLWPSGEKMSNDVGQKMFSKAGELNVPVGIMCFKGLSLHADEIETLCSLYPSTRVIIDHFGFCKPPLSEVEGDTWRFLLSLARHPQVYIRVSAFFRVSREPFPYRDTWPLLQELLNAYGAQRLMWGRSVYSKTSWTINNGDSYFCSSDFPYVNDECGYSNATRILHGAKDEGFISDDDLPWILSKTAKTLFLGQWLG